MAHAGSPVALTPRRPRPAVLLCSAVIVGVAIQCRLSNWLVHSGATARTLRDVDTWSAITWGVVWLLLQVRLT